MASSTLTIKGQTTVPREIREALQIKPRQRLEWTVRPDGTAAVQAQPSALSLFGSLRSTKRFPGRAAERAAAAQAVAKRAARKRRVEPISAQLVDTNVLVRFFTGDPPAMAERAGHLIE